MIVIGLTGGLASGKTSIARMFAALGVKVLNADTIAHRVLYKNTYCYRQTIKLFGNSVLNGKGSIDRKKLGDIVFTNKKNQKQLCSIVHPWVFDSIKKKIKIAKKNKAIKVVVIEMVLLIESGFYKNMDKIILVKSTIEQQISRATSRSNMSLEQIKQRMKFQLSFNEKAKFVDCIINNQGALKDTEIEVKKIWKAILRKTSF